MQNKKKTIENYKYNIQKTKKNIMIMMMTEMQQPGISSIKNYLDQRSKCKIIYTPAKNQADGNIQHENKSFFLKIRYL